MKSLSLKAVIIVIFTLTIAGSAVQAQEFKRRHTGITGSIQGSQKTLMLTSWLSNKVTFMPTLGVFSLSDVGTELLVGAGLRFNQGTDRSISYYGIRFGVITYWADKVDGYTNYQAGPIAGGEYYFSERFALGLEVQIVITKYDNKYLSTLSNHTTISTATAILASYYF